MKKSSKSLLVLFLLLSSCDPAGNPCLRNSDCASTEKCLNGRCSVVTSDAATDSDVDDILDIQDIVDADVISDADILDAADIIDGDIQDVSDITDVSDIDDVSDIADGSDSKSSPPSYYDENKKQENASTKSFLRFLGEKSEFSSAHCYK